MLGFASVICQCRHLPSLILNGKNFDLSTPAAPITYICVKSTSGVERVLKTLYAQRRASSAAYWKSVRLQLLPTEHVLGV